MQLLLYASFLLSATQVALGALHFQHPDELPRSTDYDFIVIGGGTGGAVVAGRLGENHNFKILVIEAGPSNNDVFETHPPGLARAVARTRVDWNYTITPQPGINGQSSTYSRAKMLGGCSSHNTNAYTRGSRDDYDGWAKLAKDESWSWDRMFSYILKAERLAATAEHQNVQGHFDPAVHGKTGRIAVSEPYFVNPFNDLLFQATKELASDFPFKLDMNDGRPLGVGWGQTTIDNGVRSSSATGYLESSAGHNIHILLNTLVTRVMPLDKANTDFRRVEFTASSGDITSPRMSLTARKEVVLAGGIINTPQVLLNSGIGSTADLGPLGIETLVENPSVGKNFSDQVAISLDFATTLPAIEFNVTTSEVEWNRSHTGPLARPPRLGPIGWVRLPDDAKPFRNGGIDPTAGRNSPHIELFFELINSQDPVIIGRPPTTDGNDSTPDPDAQVKINMFAVNLHPTARGSITLNTSNPFSKPVVDPNLFGEPIDLAILREGVRSARQLFSAPAWNNFVSGTITPAANVTTDVELETFLRDKAVPYLHGVGSAGMSPKGAKWGVVDPDFKVKGTRGLRIVDASVIPNCPSGHTQAPVYAIAELASDVIRRAWE